MSSEQALRSAAQRYKKAVDDLRAARQRFVDARPPMDPVRRTPQVWNSPLEPPTWTPEQRHAVVTYANAWMWLRDVVEEWEALTGADAPPG